jgi:hypothetical protein
MRQLTVYYGKDISQFVVYISMLVGLVVFEFALLPIRQSEKKRVEIGLCHPKECKRFLMNLACALRQHVAELAGLEQIPCQKASL